MGGREGIYLMQNEQALCLLDHYGSLCSNLTELGAPQHPASLAPTLAQLPGPHTS